MNQELAANTTLSHYRVVSKIGAGGMGEVYLAQDTKLDRRVALKILPAEFAEDKNRMGRFVREAKSASALNHPNIITIYEIGESEGTHFIATEFIDGKTLNEYAKSKPFNLNSVLEIAMQIVSALDEAHSAGITHRDIKPDNVMVRSNGLAKILDFGIAKLSAPTETGEEAATAIQGATTPGMIIGTPKYMSPEQARGRGVDHQTDIFSFGVVLYEMLSGSAPFAGDTVSDILVAVLTKEPQPLANVPPQLAAIVQKTLQKDKQKRYQTTKDLLHDLTEVKQELEARSRLGRSSAPNNKEPETQILQAPTTAEKSTTANTGSQEGFWVAVLPFKYRGANAELEALAEGLSEEVVTGLSRFSYLRVIARGSTLRYASDAGDVRTIGKELGARYVMEGSLRQAGSNIRLAVHLVDTSNGVQLWSENYQRAFSSEALFDLQDDLVPKIVSTVADWYGVLPQSMSESVRLKSPEKLSPYEALLHSYGYTARLTAEDHLETLDILEQAVGKAPGNADCWAMLSTLYADEYKFGYNLKPDPLSRTLAAALRAVEAAPSNSFANYALAQARFFLKEFDAFRSAAERAIALNPMNGAVAAYMGQLLFHAGDSERGCELSEKARQMNPQHPGWYWAVPFLQAYEERDYRRALSYVLKMNMPGFFVYHMHLTATYKQLGEHQLAAQSARDLLGVAPDIELIVRDFCEMWVKSEAAEHILEGLQKAGLKLAAAPNPAEQQSQILKAQTTGETATGNSIAVLPFQNMSADEDNEYFCDGLAEELLNALSKIDELKVAARTSAFFFKGKNTNVSEIGEKLSVNNVLEGSVRKSGDRLRISVQLISVSDGFQLWSERYDRELRDVFDVQDEIALSVVDALKLKLFGAEKVAVLKRYTDDAEVHELFLKGRYHAYKYTAEGWKRAIEFFEKAIEKQPDHAQAYAGMAAARGCLWFFGLLPAEQTIPQSKTAAIKALGIDESLADAYLSLAIITFFYAWEWEKAEQEFKRSIALNPNNAEALSYYAIFLGFEERFDEAISRGKCALEIDPLSPLINMNVGWTYFSAGLLDEASDQAGKMIEIEPEFYGTYWLKGAIYLSEGEYEAAVEELEKAVSLGGHQIVLADLGSAYGLAGEQDKAAVVLDQLLEMRRRDYVPAICLARIYSRIGEHNEAIEWLEKAFEERNGEMVFLKGEIAGAADDDALNSLGSDPKLIDLLRQMNLP
ncbi:hypothetical protein BH20ACI3_BH20ACI3_24840 [soil metagenome]